MIKEIFQMDVCHSLDEFSWLLVQVKGPISSSLLIFLFASFARALWTTRNKMAIEKKILKAPSGVLYVAISLMQKWSHLLKEKDKECIDILSGERPFLAEELSS